MQILCCQRFPGQETLVLPVSLHACSGPLNFRLLALKELWKRIIRVSIILFYNSFKAKREHPGCYISRKEHSDVGFSGLETPRTNVYHHPGRRENHTTLVGETIITKIILNQ